MAEDQGQPEAVPEAPQPLTVLMGRVLADVPAVGKNSQAPANMGGYAFRGIEDVLAALKPSMARHGVFCIPNVKERVLSERAVSGNKTMFVVDLFIEWTFYGPLGDTLTATCWGEGTDMGDKSHQKAMTSAFKSMLMQTFIIGDAASDAEAHSVPDTEGPVDPEQWFRAHEWDSKEHHDRKRAALSDLIKLLPVEAKEAFRKWLGDQTEAPSWNAAWPGPYYEAVQRRVGELIGAYPATVPEQPRTS